MMFNHFVMISNRCHLLLHRNHWANLSFYSHVNHISHGIIASIFIAEEIIVENLNNMSKVLLPVSESCEKHQQNPKFRTPESYRGFKKAGTFIFWSL